MSDHESPREFWLALGTLLLLVIALYCFILVAAAYFPVMVESVVTAP